MNWPNLWAPWRIDYIRRLPEEKANEPACFLCDAWEKTDADADHLVLHREEAGMVLLNRYPYTNGHLMVVPGRHVGDMADLEAGERGRLMEMIVLAERLIRRVLDPQGINVGINIGRAAGAGLPGHVHVHVVPRWGGDTNFMHVIGQVRVSPQAIEQVYEEMAAALAEGLDG